MPSAYIKSRMKSYMQEEEIIKILQEMAADNTYHTKSGYTVNSEVYADHVIPFVEKHVSYLNKHPHVDPKHYLSNLRLMLKVR